MLPISEINPPIIARFKNITSFPNLFFSLQISISQFQKLEFSYGPVLFYNYSVDNILHYL